MNDQVVDPALPSDSLPMQPHTCTAVIEELVVATPEEAWEDAD